MVQGRGGEEPCQVWELSGGVKLLRDTYSSSALTSIILLLLQNRFLAIASDEKRVQGHSRESLTCPAICIIAKPMQKNKSRGIGSGVWRFDSLGWFLRHSYCS